MYVQIKWALRHPFRFIRKRLGISSKKHHYNNKIAIYISSHGNYFFNEILTYFQEGFIELGYVVTIKTEVDNFGGEFDWHIVIAPHEFFFMGTGPRFLDVEWPSNTIIVNFEQPSLYWYNLVERCLDKAYAVWDINCKSAQILAEKHRNVRFLPPGYVELIERRNTVVTLPNNQTTETLDVGSWSGDFLHKDFSERPIDICFIGVLSERRDIFLLNTVRFLQNIIVIFIFGEVISQ